MIPRSFIPVSKPRFGIRERLAVDRVLRSGKVAQGVEVELFENEFSEFVEGAHCVAVNSGTSALHLGLLAAGIGKGDEVIVPSFTFAATANAVAMVGAIPVFVDVSEDDFCLDPEAVAAAVSSRTAAVLPVHLYGQPARLDQIKEITEKDRLLLIEDAAQAHSAALRGKAVGTFGEFGMFSFYPTKNMSSGEGGMVVTNSSELARKVRILRNQGMIEQYKNEEVGLNNRLTEISAAIGRVQLSKLEEWTSRRISNANHLSRNLTGVKLPAVRRDVRHVFHQFTIRVKTDRNRFVTALRERWGVGSGIYYPTPVHLLPPYRELGGGLDLPVTRRLAREVVSLPVHQWMSHSSLQRVVKAVNSESKEVSI